ncbi:plasmid pRiA4b ORF-3 family protein [Paenibacillus oenotherae]|uniref:Plasmid pRiA4b ORF-3 family protein n=1 Tax=Paenibacillus oenotherae TaxID=1435645 RepID=A0ABS7D9X6_9BACL|nr:plasmid pRiA4b ORF-3 family protein [Paenibacillus oenotherae]MBW7475973.1 plasmid pRiA4b ORF-3 family protein [Paenibacillus oenotherae]
MQAKEFKVIWSDWNGAVRGRPSRSIAVQADATLYDLAAAVLSSFDFDMDHAFGFYDNLKDWTSSQIGYEWFADMGERGMFPGVKRTRISKAFRTDNQKLLLLFDYGDEWRFVVQYIKEIDSPAGKELPMVLSSKGNAPSQYGDDEYEDEGEC